MNKSVKTINNWQLVIRNLYIVFFVFSIILITNYQLLISEADAQTEAQVILSWQANNFYPADYAGKALPTFGTPFSVSAEVIQNNKLIDLSKANFLWYVDENLVKRGEGIKEINFKAGKAAGDHHFIRVVIELNNNSFQNSTRVPIQKPLVIIESPYPNKLVQAGSQILLRAVPYFFNVTSIKDLEFSWQINNQKQKTGSDNELLITLGSPNDQTQNLIRLTVSAQNRNSQFEFGNNKSDLTIY